MSQPYFPLPPAGPDPADPLISNGWSGWCNRSFRLGRAAWRPMTAVQLIVTLPAVIVLAPALAEFADEQRAVPAAADFSQLVAGRQILLPAAALAALLLLLGQLATQQVVVRVATGRPGHHVGPALLAGAKRLPMLIGWCLLSIPVLIVALVLCFFPVVYVGAALTVLPVVVLLERGAGIGRCFQLFHANIGVSLSRIATIAALGLGSSLALTLLQTLVDAVLAAGPATVVNAVLEAGYSIISYLVLAPLLVTAYADMRARREAFTTADLVTPGR